MASGMKGISAQAIPLTLRTLYQMLTKRDYLSYLLPVFDNSDIRGRILVSFWYGLLSKALPEDFDLEIFIADEERSRSLGSLLNRSGNDGLMKARFEALSDRLSETMFVRLAASWVETLSAGTVF